MRKVIPSDDSQPKVWGDSVLVMIRSSPWQRSRAITAVFVVTCIFFGLVLLIFDIELSLQEFDEDTPDAEVSRVMTSYLLPQFPAALVVWALLPKAISHDPREFVWRDPVPGTRSTLLAAVVVVTVGLIYGLTVPAGMVAMISMVSRNSWKWTTLAIISSITAVVVSLLRDPFGPLGAGVLAFATVFIALGLAGVVAVGQYRSSQREQVQATITQAHVTELEAEQARAEERAGMAVDIHDTVSHRLALISIHAAVLEKGVPDHEPQLADAARTVREQSVAASEDLRSLLAVTPRRDDPLTPVDDVIAEYRATGMDISTSGLDPLGESTTTEAHLIHRVLGAWVFSW